MAERAAGVARGFQVDLGDGSNIGDKIIVRSTAISIANNIRTLTQQNASGLRLARDFLSAKEGEDKDLDRTTRQPDDRVEQRQTVGEESKPPPLKSCGCVYCDVDYERIERVKEETIKTAFYQHEVPVKGFWTNVPCTAPPLGAAQRSRSDEVLAERKEESPDPMAAPVTFVNGKIVDAFVKAFDAFQDPGDSFRSCVKHALTVIAPAIAARVV